jgi:hypothetical protein
MIRLAAALGLCALLGACGTAADLGETPAPLGDFRLGHNIVIAPNLTRGPVSREATEEEWIAAVSKAVGDRFGRYEGDRYYHFGISVEGYVLAQPGLPVVASPRSALILRVTVWDDAAQAKLNDEPETVTVTEAVSGETMLGSGLTQTREQQMENLAISAARQIERWLERQNRWEGWFGGRAASARIAAALEAGTVDVPAPEIPAETPPETPPSGASGTGAAAATAAE